MGYKSDGGRQYNRPKNDLRPESRVETLMLLLLNSGSSAKRVRVCGSCKVVTCSGGSGGCRRILRFSDRKQGPLYSHLRKLCLCGLLVWFHSRHKTDCRTLTTVLHCRCFLHGCAQSWHVQLQGRDCQQRDLRRTCRLEHERSQ